MPMGHIEKMGKSTSILSLIEIGLGSLLHTFKIPFSGHFLSLNQGFILTRASRDIPEFASAPATISATAALLKSLSPAGKKLTPMLAIAAQGQLYNLGTFILGNHFLGHLMGMWLLCLWSFIQPILLYLLIFGKDLIFVYNYFFQKLEAFLPLNNQTLLIFLIGLILIKILLGTFLVIFAHILSEEKWHHYLKWGEKYKKTSLVSTYQKRPYLMAFKDMLNPFYLISFGLTFFFFYFSQSQTFWPLLRPIALGYTVFLFIRIVPNSKIANWLERKLPILAKTLKEAKASLK